MRKNQRSATMRGIPFSELVLVPGLQYSREKSPHQSDRGSDLTV
jgi:hypothetical protein